MAIVKTLPFGGKGAEIWGLQSRLFVSHDYTSTSGSIIKFHDDSLNYALFTGTSFTVVKSGMEIKDVTSGTVTKFDLVLDGVKMWSFSGLDMSAAKLLDYYIAGNSWQVRELLFAGNDTITGTAYSDELFGEKGSDKIYGGGGNDILYGGDGNDTVKGEAGDDALYGNLGRDRLEGGSGNDMLYARGGGETLIGGDGVDTVSYIYEWGGVKISLASSADNAGGAQGDTYSSIENLRGGAGNDVLIGNSGKNKIDGGSSSNMLTGGKGADLFVFAKNHYGDTITDFTDDVDRIDLRSYDFASASSVLDKAVQVHGDVEIRMSRLSVLTLKDFSKANLDAGDFLL
ncbi:M10 family metallopeptidase C-terminal domain-containing protein [Shinella sp. CPCC 101442]|uniref:calcium-binding protein n=1 Tax=Shinella sp. CPCC 101442 TaxID=2932265 RepID=UPI0021535A75|nr:M10 family metallopeptidase C-terminal domain-containing protein [Shinella sp. CPCC 101442]MCR6498710.1 M10 family metallopeptidase C-terminal domain-containing protein [Shinella sp. CPCC 101442]